MKGWNPITMKPNAAIAHQVDLLLRVVAMNGFSTHHNRIATYHFILEGYYRPFTILCA